MNSDTQARLILFTRYPEPGQSKTRLIPALGAQGAALLQRRMSEAMAALLAEFAARYPVRPEIRYTGGSRQAMESWLNSPIPCLDQGEGDLGERLQRAFSQAFARGDRQVVVIGADCPGLDADLLAQAFAALAQHDLVLGPAMDGGYYLIGLSLPAYALFADIPWGSDMVLAATMEQAQALALTIHTLETLADVDRPEDLRYFDYHPGPQ